MERTWKPTVAGILCIIDGLICVIPGILLVLFIVSDGSGWPAWAAIPSVIVGIIPIVGGIYALRRRVWGLALGGAILAFIGFGILSLLAIMLPLILVSDVPEAIPFGTPILEALGIVWSRMHFGVRLGFLSLLSIFALLGIFPMALLVKGRREFK